MRENEQIRTATLVDTARWSYGGYAKLYPWAQCRYCGRAQDHNCAVAECPLCGSRVCFGAGNKCKVCHYGWIPGWSHGYGEDRECGYAGCTRPAIADAPRVKRVCLTHVGRVKVNRVPLPDYVAAQIANRDAGKGWERWRYVV